MKSVLHKEHSMSSALCDQTIFRNKAKFLSPVERKGSK